MRSSGNCRPRFAADEMLGSLAKWLRIIGYDTSYERDKKDDRILELARIEGRSLLTRDKMLARAAGEDGLYILSDDVDEQLLQVARHFSLIFHENLTRCATCGGELESISRSEASVAVPPRSLAMTDEFFRCRSCGKHYWKGTHWKSIIEKLERIGISQERSLE